MNEWLAIARRPDIVYRSLRVALVVGTVLVLINHGDRIATGVASGADWLKIGLTYLVPYAVSTWAAVSTIRAAGKS
jgi:hypothetical protein